MFIGVIKDTGIVEQSDPELVIKVNSDFAVKITTGSHIAVNGKNLRVAGKENKNGISRLTFYNSNLNKPKNYLPQEKVNLEPAVCLGEEIPGIYFYGIPNGLVELVSKNLLSDGKCLMKVAFKNDLVNYLSVEDIVCLHGALIQIVDLDNYFISCNIYPNTLKITNLGEKQVGDKLNIEIDPLVAKIAKILPRFNR